MVYVDAYPAMDRQEVLRWSFCAAAVLLVHATVLLALWARPDFAESDAGAPVVLIELASLAVAPTAPETDVAPGPQQGIFVARSVGSSITTPSACVSEKGHERPY